LKQLLTYFLLAFVLYAFHYKTINYCLETAEHQCAYMQDYDCEEEDSQSQKSDEKNEKEEKKELSEYLAFDNIYTVTLIQRLSFAQQAKLMLIPSGYSKAVYSPPETNVI